MTLLQTAKHGQYDTVEQLVTDLGLEDEFKQVTGVDVNNFNPKIMTEREAVKQTLANAEEPFGFVRDVAPDGRIRTYIVFEPQPETVPLPTAVTRQDLGLVLGAAEREIDAMYDLAGCDDSAADEYCEAYRAVSTALDALNGDPPTDEQDTENNADQQTLFGVNSR